MKSKILFQIPSISILTFAAALLAAPASAQIQAGDWEAGFGLGGTELDSELSDDAGFRGELRGGTRFFFRQDGTVAARFEVSSLWEDTLDETHRHTSYTAGLVWRIR